jgi:hypothetical protein
MTLPKEEIVNVNQEWRDRYGFIHLQPSPEPNATVNPGLFTGTNIVLNYMNGRSSDTEHQNFLASICWLIDKDGDWNTTPIANNKKFSRDDFTGVVSALKVIMRYQRERYNKFRKIKELEKNAIHAKSIYDDAKALLDKVPIFHKQLDHPRDFVLVGYAKYPWLFFPLLPITSGAMIVSCYQDDKVRKGIEIPKTDGKIMALITAVALKMRWTFKQCDKLIKKKQHDPPIPTTAVKLSEDRWVWLNWTRVFKYYFKNHDHPNVKAIEEWELKR